MHNSHFIGRSRYNTRYDEENCDALCMACHTGANSISHDEYVNFKKNQLGDRKYAELIQRGQTIVKQRDYKTPEFYEKLKERLADVIYETY
mgnify:FL=1